MMKPLILGLLLLAGPVLAQESKSAPAIALTEVERLKVEKLVLEIEKLDAQIQLLQERKERLRTVDGQRLIEATFKAHQVTPATHNLNLPAMQLEPISPPPAPASPPQNK